MRWVADHRKHHAFSDADGDPHSPWAYGDDRAALIKGLLHAHTGWLFDVEQTPQQQVRAGPDQGPRHRPDLAAVPAVGRRVPAAAGRARRADHWSWQGAVTAFFWGSLVRVALLHHVTWSINSICHALGQAAVRLPRPLRQRLVAGDPVRAASRGTTCTTPTRPARGTACSRARSTRGARVIGLFEQRRLGERRALARPERLARAGREARPRGAARRRTPPHRPGHHGRGDR